MRSRVLILASLIFIAACSSSNHYSSLNRQQVAERIDRNISEKDFVIDVDRALPAQGRSVSLSGGYSLRIHNDTVYSHLPYYGRAYSLPYGGGEGLNFEGAMEGYRAETGSKGECVISFQVKTKEDRYTFNITIWETGSANLTVLSTNKQTISFTGKMRLTT
ncbi:MAG: DUF4251 domain-containing protein [Rikenellaceae bacterium]|nr:DUF4251 domain-containing protein [Rikenellaceae bacterium]